MPRFPERLPRHLAIGGAAIALIATLGVGHVAATTAAEGTIRQVDPSAVTLSPHPTVDGVANGPVHGGPGAEGLYAGTGLMSEGSVFPPHTHPDERMSLVVSGTMYLGEGDVVDPARTVAYPAGTVAITPANTVHYMMAIDGDVRILEIGSGPSGVRFADDG